MSRKFSVVRSMERDGNSRGGKILPRLRQHGLRYVVSDNLFAERVEQMQLTSGATRAVQHASHVATCKEDAEEFRDGGIMLAERPKNKSYLSAKSL